MVAVKNIRNAARYIHGICSGYSSSGQDIEWLLSTLSKERREPTSIHFVHSMLFSIAYSSAKISKERLAKLAVLSISSLIS